MFVCLCDAGRGLEGDSPRVPGTRSRQQGSPDSPVMANAPHLAVTPAPLPRMNTDKLFESHGGQRLRCWLPESSCTEETRQEVGSRPDASR